MMLPAGVDLSAAREMVRREIARRSLLAFTRYTFPGYAVGWFSEIIATKLDKFLADVLAKRSPRLIIQAPPRSGKSELVSRRFPAFALGREPDLSIIATSYAADLASKNNRDVQRIIDEPNYHELFPETKLWGSNVRTVTYGSYMRNSDIFEIVGRQGVYRCAGVGGGITGMGGQILIVDDPIKDDVEASSEVYRQRVWDWYTSTLFTRRAPGGGVLIIMTRWHEDDLVGRLLDAMKKGEGETWDVCRFPAIAEEDERDEQGRLLRREGEPLQAERFSLTDMETTRKAVGSRVWISLYQQRPTAAAGNIFKREHWRYFKPTTEDPRQLIRDLKIQTVIQAWDTGFKVKHENDPSAGITIGVAPTCYYVLDMWRQRVEYPDLKRTVVAHHAKWNPGVLLVEDAASGQSLIQELKRETRLAVLPIKPDRDKVARANAITPQLEAGLVHLPESAPWLADFIDECAAFPNGAHDDQVDALTMALEYAVSGGGGMGLFAWYRQAADAEKARREAARGV